MPASNSCNAARCVSPVSPARALLLRSCWPPVPAGAPAADVAPLAGRAGSRHHPPQHQLLMRYRGLAGASGKRGGAVVPLGERRQGFAQARSEAHTPVPSMQRGHRTLLACRAARATARDALQARSAAGSGGQARLDSVRVPGRKWWKTMLGALQQCSAEITGRKGAQ